MKIVLRHRLTGRYYCSPGKWVRRADNALAFDDLDAARQFTLFNHLDDAQPVHRLAPYVMGLLRQPQASFWEFRTCRRAANWDFQQRARYFRN